MKHIYFITGSSRGLGKALAEKLLAEGASVVGMARSASIEHSRYTHVNLDLADLAAVKAFNFDVPADADRIVLVNNAGVIGNIARTGSLDDDDVIRTYNVNLVSPTILMNRFIAQLEAVESEKIIVNVSSGAGKNPIDAWATYCATKAGLDLFSRTVNAEQEIGAEHPVKVLSIAPGIVDTDMQAEIRASDSAQFSRRAEFIEFKNAGNLVGPELVAEQYFYILSHLQEFTDTLYSVRDLESK